MIKNQQKGEIVKKEEIANIKAVIKHIEERQCAKDLVKEEGKRIIAECKKIKENEYKQSSLTNLCLGLGLNTGERVEQTEEGKEYEWPDCPEKGMCPICDETTRAVLEAKGLPILNAMLAEQKEENVKIEVFGMGRIFDTGNINEMLAKLEASRAETVARYQ
jgi:hypothetical protein